MRFSQLLVESDFGFELAEVLPSSGGIFSIRFRVVALARLRRWRLH